MKTQAKIQKWGNSLAIRLTGAIKDIAHLQEGMQMEIEASEHCIKLYPSTKKTKLQLRYTEKELLKKLNAYTSHADELVEFIDKEIDFNVKR